MALEKTAVRHVSASDLGRVLDLPSLIDALEHAFAAPPPVPPRTQNVLPHGRLLVMPAWDLDGVGGVKLAVALPANRNTDLPEIQATYLLYDGRGTLRAVLDGHALTLIRTAAASAVASRRLARPDASRLLVIGAGALAPWLARAHAAVRPIRSIRVWSRSRASMERAVSLLADACDDVATVHDLDAAIPQADLITCATPSTRPLVTGALVAPGTHVDLVGSFTPTMRESDAALLARAQLYVDTREGAFSEAGDVIQAVTEGLLDEDDVVADLSGLAARTHPGRTDDDAVTVYKSVGHALQDLVAARLACARLGIRVAARPGGSA